MSNQESTEVNSVPVKARSEALNLNLKELFYKYVRFLPLYVIFVALALIGAYIYLRYTTEVYRSTGQIVIKDDNGVGGQNDKLDRLMQTDNGKNIQTEVEILQSRPVMSRVVEALNLNFGYYSKGRFKELNIYKAAPFIVEAQSIADSTKSFALNLVFVNEQAFKINGSGQTYLFGQVIKNDCGAFRIVRTKPGILSQEYDITWTPTGIRAASLLDGLAVAPKQSSGILTITMESTSPYLAADVINQLMEEYKDITIEDKNEVTRRSLNFIDATLKERENELDSIKRVFVAYQKTNNIIDPETQSTNYFRRVEAALEKEQEQRLKLGSAIQLQDYLRNQANSQSSVPSSLGIEDPTLNALVAGYNQAQLERKELLANAPAENIVVQQKMQEVEALRQKILENINNIRTAYGATIGSLQASSGNAQSQIKTIPTKKQDLINIQQDLEQKALIYNSLLAKREESAIALASTISNTKVLQEAAPSMQPVKPNPRNVKILAVLIGIVIPTIIIVILELLNDKVSSKNDIERLTNATIIGEVGHSTSGETLVVTQNNRRFIAEQFRVLRSNLQFVLTNTPKPVIMVTSSFSGEGKSFVSTNMGAVMALANKKAIILELDIRKPKIVAGLGLPKQKGFTSFILGQASLQELPVSVPGFENLYVLPCGPVPPNPSELLLDQKLDELFLYLKENFDVVIMDTAPVGMVSDALTLSKYANCTLYLVRQGHTYKKQLQLIEDYYQQQKLPKISIVLNDIKVKTGYGSYGYGRYGYGYGYGAGYFDEEEQGATGFSRWFSWLGHKNGANKTHKKKNV